MSKEKYNTCRYVKEVGQLAVYVRPGCPQAILIKGRLVSSKLQCRKCEWEAKEDGETKRA